LTEAVEILRACQRIVDEAAPRWWALENPLGRIVNYLGPPRFKFQPWDFGDPWTKLTLLWGEFVIPARLVFPKKPDGMSVPGHRSQQHKRFLNTLDFQKALDLGMVRADWIHRLGPSPERAALRSITPPAFARAFFEANP
jgi:hypothetical protein